MGMKWLEQRWEALIPALEPLGQDQEEWIRELCEAEKEWWRQRSSMKVESSLKKPMTETRNYIREVLLLREDNWWVNPKSGAKEHLALKYMNFSSEEWTQMSLPTEEQLQERVEQPLLLADPEEIVARGEQLLQMETWPELVVGIGLNTGRTLAEILKTGVFRSKTAYSVHIACPFTVYELMSEFFEVPTLSHAQLVLDAYAKVRQIFGLQFAFVSRRDVGRQCGQEVMKVAYQYFGDLVPLRQGEKDLFKALSRGVYSCLAAHYYCPSWVEEVHYLMTIKNHRKWLEATSEAERLTFALATSCLDYALVGSFEQEGSRKGTRLGTPDVDVLEVFRLGTSGAEEQVC